MLSFDLAEDLYRETKDGSHVRRRRTLFREKDPRFGESMLSVVRRSYRRIEEVTLRRGRSGAVDARRSQKIMFGFLALGPLRSLRCIDTKFPASFENVKNAPASSTVRELTLYKCAITPGGLGSIFDTCRSLESFMLFALPNDALLSAKDSAVWHASLCKHKNSLKSLELINDGGPHDDVTGYQPIRGLLDCHLLQELTIDEALLMETAGWAHTDLGAVLPSSISKLRIDTTAKLDEIADILMAFRGWKPSKLVSLDISFMVVLDGLNSEYTEEWDSFNGGIYSHSQHNEEDFRVTLFVVDGFAPDDLHVLFKSSELAVARNLAKLGGQLSNGGLERFLDAAEVGEDVSLWEGGPKRSARSMFLDGGYYELDSDFSDEDDE